MGDSVVLRLDEFRDAQGNVISEPAKYGGANGNSTSFEIPSGIVFMRVTLLDGEDVLLNGYQVNIAVGNSSESIAFIIHNDLKNTENQYSTLVGD